jgi:hypothetical protein
MVTKTASSIEWDVSFNWCNFISYDLIIVVGMWRMPLGFPVVRAGQQLIRPVHVSDVSKGLNNLMYDESSLGKTFEFYGYSISPFLPPPSC